MRDLASIARSGEAALAAPPASVPSAATARGVVLLCPGQGQVPRELGALVRASGDDLASAYVERLGAGALDDAYATYAHLQAALVAVGVGRGRRALATLGARDGLGPGAPDGDALADGPVVAIAGHSLGELVALCLAGVLRPGAAVRLAADRGAAFDHHRVPLWDETGMLALRGPGLRAAVDAGLLDRHGLELGNDNAPDQVVAVGLRTALAAATAEAKALGLRAVRLETTGPSHSSYVAPAAATFRRALDQAHFGAAQLPVYSGLAAAPFTDYRGQLAAGIPGRVRWRETLLSLAALGPAAFLDIGPGKVLANLARSTAPGIAVRTLDELALVAEEAQRATPAAP